MCVSMIMNKGMQEGSKRASDSLKLELQELANHSKYFT